MNKPGETGGEQGKSPRPSKLKIALNWIFLVGNVIFWCFFWIWRDRGHGSAAESGPEIVHSIFMAMVGVAFLGVGGLGYILCSFTACLTFNFTRPVWKMAKGKLFVVNIFVPLAFSLGLGFMVSTFLTPLLKAAGIAAGTANILPVVGAVMLFQIGQLWVLIWAPMERDLIRKRLRAQGITMEQIRAATLVGLSNPASNALKRFGAVEEDMGALWITPDHLIYRGDVENFSLTREQVLLIERKADARSTTMLAGIAHVVLHVKCDEGPARQIRLHVEGVWTMGQKKAGMNALAESITSWHGIQTVAEPV